MNFRKIPGIAEECIYVFQCCKRVAAAGKLTCVGIFLRNWLNYAHICITLL